MKSATELTRIKRENEKATRFTATVFLIAIFITLLYYLCSVPGFKAGQVWYNETGKGDPFNSDTIKIKVIDVREGHIMYLTERGDTCSGPVHWYRSYELIK